MNVTKFETWSFPRRGEVSQVVVAVTTCSVTRRPLNCAFAESAKQTEARPKPIVVIAFRFMARVSSKALVDWAGAETPVAAPHPTHPTMSH